eukprot:403362160
MENPEQLIKQLQSSSAISKAGRFKDQGSHMLTKLLVASTGLKQNRNASHRDVEGQIQNPFQQKRGSLQDKANLGDIFTEDLKQHFKQEGTIDVSKFRSQQNQKMIKQILTQDSKKNQVQNSSLPQMQTSIHDKVQIILQNQKNEYILSQNQVKTHKQERISEIALNGIPREKRQKQQDGEKFNIAPPVGIYNPNPEFIMRKNAQNVKFNYLSALNSKNNSRDNSLDKDGSQSYLSPLTKSKISLSILPSIIQSRYHQIDKSSQNILLDEIPEKIKSHIPAVYLEKQSKRKMECMKANITDDSNIEYNNIFPRILSHNRKLSTNINIKKMTNRPAFFKDISGSPYYMDGMGLKQSNSRAQLQQLNRKYVDMADRGETLKREIMEEIDSEKDYIMKHIKRQPEQKEQEYFQSKIQQE